MCVRLNSGMQIVLMILKTVKIYRLETFNRKTIIFLLTHSNFDNQEVRFTSVISEDIW